MLNTVFISPHHDDVCFSMAATVLECQGGQLINVFTQSDYAVVPLPLFKDRDERIKYVTNLRTSEDQIFAEACKLTRHDLMLEEPPVIGVHPFDLSDVQVEVKRLSSVLVDYLIRLQTNSREKPALFCPMGIGGHRNHVSVLTAIVNALPRLRELYDLRFYEDLHYASRNDYKKDGLLRFLSMFQGERPTRRVLILTPELFALKMQLVSIYASQHEVGQPRTSDFIPAMDGILVPHETVWSLPD